MNATYMVPGLLVAASGLVTIFVLLARRRSLRRSKQLGALSDLASGRAGPRARTALFAALLAIALGSCLCFAGVAMGDRDRERACVETCRARGYAKAAIRGSTARDPDRPERSAFVACACEGGGSQPLLELDADRM